MGLQAMDTKKGGLSAPVGLVGERRQLQHLSLRHPIEALLLGELPHVPRRCCATGLSLSTVELSILHAHHARLIGCQGLDANVAVGLASHYGLAIVALLAFIFRLKLVLVELNHRFLPFRPAGLSIGDLLCSP